MVQYHLHLCDQHDQHLHEQRAQMLTAKCEAEIQVSIQVKEKNQKKNTKIKELFLCCGGGIYKFIMNKQ